MRARCLRVWAPQRQRGRSCAPSGGRRRSSCAPSSLGCSGGSPTSHLLRTSTTLYLLCLRRSVTLLVAAAVGVLVALAIGDSLRSGRSSSAAGTAPTTTPAPTTDTAPPPNSTPVREVARAPNTCGAFRIALLRLSAPRRRGRRWERQLSRRAGRDEGAVRTAFLSGSWVCDGPEGTSTCEKRSGDAVRAHFADALGDPEWAIERIANRWARIFASTKSYANCSSHMTQPLCERIACETPEHVKIPNCTPPTTAYRRSFGKARVEEIAIRGERVAARFSNSSPGERGLPLNRSTRAAASADTSHRDACSRGDEGVEVPGALPTSSRRSCVRPSPHIVHGRWAHRRHGGKRCERVDVGPIR